jgi:hypothetical protein
MVEASRPRDLAGGVACGFVGILLSTLPHMIQPVRIGEPVWCADYDELLATNPQIHHQRRLITLGLSLAFLLLAAWLWLRTREATRTAQPIAIAKRLEAFDRVAGAPPSAIHRFHVRYVVLPHGEAGPPRICRRGGSRFSWGRLGICGKLIGPGRG